jgi:hypothetical protein
MMNCSFSSYSVQLRLLELMEHRVRTAPSSANALMGTMFSEPPSENWKKITHEVAQQIRLTEMLFARLESHVLAEHIRSIRRHLEYSSQLYSGEIADGLKAIRGIIEIEIGNHHFYHYPLQKAGLLINVESEWGAVFVAFPQAKSEIISGVDCYACGLDTACVFHMMRAVEVGLRQIGPEAKIKIANGKPLTHAQWGDILGAIERRIKQVENTKADTARDAALAYFSGIQGHLRALRDKYRNNVMHAKSSFTEHEARDAMFHTRSFLAGLASRPNRRRRSTRKASP